MPNLFNRNDFYGGRVFRSAAPADKHIIAIAEYLYGTTAANRAKACKA